VTQKAKTCELFYTTIRNETVAQADKTCSTTPVKSQLQQLKSPLPDMAAPAAHL
jgi:hypothetical protein